MKNCTQYKTVKLVFHSSFRSVANLNTYIISYLRVDNPEVTYADWVIVSTTKPVILGLFMTFSGEISRKIGLRLSIAIGAAIYRFVLDLYYIIRMVAWLSYVEMFLFSQYRCLHNRICLECKFMGGNLDLGRISWILPVFMLCPIN